MNENDFFDLDRRQRRRYVIELSLRWRLLRRRKVVESGSGRTIDMSSAGIMFNAGSPLPAGLDVELSIAWPALLHQRSPLQLTVNGRIVRCNGNCVAVRIAEHEFRTISLLHASRPSNGVIRPPCSLA